MNEIGTTKIQLAIQGGGAKIAALLAAAEAIEQLVADKRIEVTRIAGTSAGAIVACILATQKVDSSTLRDKINHEYRGDLQTLFPTLSPAQSYWRVFRGRSLLDVDGLRKFLHKFFAKYKLETLKELDLPVFVLAADVLNGKKQVFSTDATPDEKLADCLVHSCALPFVFKTHRNLGNPAYVDGGICENLPSDELFDEEEKYGRVVGISFARQGIVEQPTSVLQFARALIDTSISNSMNRARNRIGASRVYSIETNLPTLGFQEAFGSGLGPGYDLIHRKTLDWFETAVPLLEVEEKRSRVIFGDPWRDASKDAAQLMADLNGVYENSLKRADLQVAFSGISVVTYDLLKDDKRQGIGDVVTQRIRFRPTRFPLTCYRMSLSSDREINFVQKAIWSITDPLGNQVPFTAIPVLAEPDDRGVLIFFDRPLDPPESDDAWYTLEQTDMASNTMGGLVEKGNDFLANTNLRPSSIGEMHLMLQIPVALGPAKVESTGRGRQARSEEFQTWGSPHPGFAQFGWVCENVKSDERVEATFSVEH